jgi:flagellar protein FliS
MAMLNPYNYKKPVGAVNMRPAATAMNNPEATPKNQQDIYLEQKVMSAKPEELTLMLYDGLVKFIKKARLFNEQKDIQKTHENVVKAQAIVLELQATLNMDYAISDELDALYDFIYEMLVEANLSKNDKPLADALEISESMRDTWKEAMRLT